MLCAHTRRGADKYPLLLSLLPRQTYRSITLCSCTALTAAETKAFSPGGNPAKRLQLLFMLLLVQYTCVYESSVQLLCSQHWTRIYMDRTEHLCTCACTHTTTTQQQLTKWALSISTHSNWERVDNSPQSCSGLPTQRAGNSPWMSLWLHWGITVWRHCSNYSSINRPNFVLAFGIFDRVKKAKFAVWCSGLSCMPSGGSIGAR